MDLDGLEYIVAGAGLSGLTVAERLHAAGRKVAVVDRRAELGGLCAGYVDSDTGVHCHRYGSHIFHTDDQRVADYLQRFCGLNAYRHRVLARAGRKLYPWPVNLMTINMFFGLDLTPRQAAGFQRVMVATYSDQPPEILIPPEGQKVAAPTCAPAIPPATPADRRRLREVKPPRDFREAVVAKIGRPLYEAFVQGYSRKQWGCDPCGLPVSLAGRIGARTDYNMDYFQGRWQGVPTSGWHKVFERMAKGIDVHLGIDYFEIRHQLPQKCRVVYTGPLDEYFAFRLGHLSWRGVYLETEAYQIGDYQGAAVVNHCDESVPYTRVHEYRHLNPGRHQSRRKTIIAKEYPVAGGERAYPVNPEGELAATYRTAAMAERNVTFVGRLATYRYLNMDQAVSEALRAADGLLKT